MKGIKIKNIYKKMKIYSDYLRYRNRKRTLFSLISIVIYPGFLTILIFRIADFLYRTNKHFYILSKIMMLFPRVLFGIDISIGAKIEKGFKIEHGNGIVIGPKVHIYENVTILQGVTLGGNFGKKMLLNKQVIEQPIIGANSFLGPGAKILGPSIIEEGCLIGANVVIVNKRIKKGRIIKFGEKI